MGLIWNLFPLHSFSLQLFPTILSLFLNWQLREGTLSSTSFFLESHPLTKPMHPKNPFLSSFLYYYFGSMPGQLQAPRLIPFQSGQRQVIHVGTKNSQKITFLRPDSKNQTWSIVRGANPMGSSRKKSNFLLILSTLQQCSPLTFSSFNKKTTPTAPLKLLAKQCLKWHHHWKRIHLRKTLIFHLHYPFFHRNGLHASFAATFQS